MARVIVKALNSTLIKKPIRIEIDGFYVGKIDAHEFVDTLVFSGKHTIQAVARNHKSTIIEFNIYERERVLFSCSFSTENANYIQLNKLQQSSQPQRFKLSLDSNRTSSKPAVIQNNEESDYYAVLGVDEHASNEEIRNAYIALMKQYHPDRSTQLDQKTRNQIGNKAMEANLAYGYIKVIRNM